MSEIDLTQINVWLDVIFSTLYVVIILALVVHFSLSIPTGRFRKKWIEKKWPEHDEPHPPALPKFMHFQHLSMMFVLGFTGLYIRFPFFDGGRTVMRYIHYVAMIVVTLNLLWRFWYAFGSRRRDWRAFAVTGRDIRSMLGVMGYYAYILKTKPHTDKYNVMQKLVYQIFALFMLMQAYSGFSLLEFVKLPLIGHSPSYWLLFGWFPGNASGYLMFVAYARLLHYFLTWMFIILTTIHAYLSATEDVPATLMFFGLAGHEDEHGADVHAPAHDLVPVDGD